MTDKLALIESIRQIRALLDLHEQMLAELEAPVKKPVLDIEPEPTLVSSHVVVLPLPITSIIEGGSPNFYDIIDPDAFKFSFIQVDKVFDDGTIQFRRWQTQHQYIKEVLVSPKVLQFVEPGKSYIVRYAYIDVKGRKKEMIDWAAFMPDQQAFTKAARTYQPLINQHLKRTFTTD